MKYAICDLETTGLDISSQIIEVAILIVEDGKVVDSFQSLINPLIKVPETVLELTGVSQRQLDSAPKFYDLASTLFNLLDGVVFVSHKIEFDYGVLDQHFKLLGYNLTNKTFCTLKKSQDLIPGLASYSLDAMCAFFNIKVKERHRAWPDALLCFEIFKELQGLLAPQTVELYLPHHKVLLKSLSHGPGILFFKNSNHEVIYSKACFDIYEVAQDVLKYQFEKRVFLSGVTAIDFVMTRSELLAQIRLEQFSPRKHQWGLYLGEKKNGQKVLYPDKLRKKSNLIWSDSSKKEVLKKMKALSSGPNQDYVYRDDLLSKEAIVQRNIELSNRLRGIQFSYSDLLITFEGAHPDELDFILVRGFSARGMGTVHKDRWEQLVEKPEAYLKEKWSYSPEINQIVRNYLISLKNNKYKKESLRVLSSRPTLKMRESYESKEV